MIIKRYAEIVDELNKIPSLRFLKQEFAPIAAELLKLELSEECKKVCKDESNSSRVKPVKK